MNTFDRIRRGARRVETRRAGWMGGVVRCMLMLALLPILSHAQTTFTVTVVSKGASHPNPNAHPEVYAIDGVQGKELTLVRGVTYTFKMSSVPQLHPFYISTSSSGAGAGQYSDGVTGSFATQNATLTFTPGASAPDLLYYQCAVHPDMGWKINIVDEASGVDESLGIIDPAVMVADMPEFAGLSKTHRRSFVPHWESAIAGLWPEVCATVGVNYIDPRGEAKAVIAEIARSELIIAESMHGAILADAFRVPWVAVSTSRNINSFKWNDWAGTLGVSYRPRHVPVSSRAEAIIKGARFWGVDFEAPRYSPAEPAAGHAGDGEVMVREKEPRSTGFRSAAKQVLAALVRTHRRGVPKTAFDALPDRLLLSARRKAALLRLAVLLHRAHDSDQIPRLEVSASGNRMELVLDRGWIDSRPLLRADLLAEKEGMPGLGIDFQPMVA